MRPVMLVGLAPLLGATDLLVNALGLSLVALPLLIVLGALGAWLGRLEATVRGIALLLVACVLLTLADLLLHAFALELRNALGIFLPLLLLAVAAPPADFSQGLRQGLLFSGAALLLGALRECLGSGTLFKHTEWLFGPAAGSWTLQVSGFGGLHLFALVPGAFILLGLLWAIARRLLCPSSIDSDA